MSASLHQLFLVLLVASLTGLAILGRSGAGATVAPTPLPTNTAQPQPTPTVPVLSFLTPGASSASSAPTPAPAVARASSSEMADPMGADPIELGRQIFMKGTDRKNQIGCQYCHGADAKGNIGPYIRGKTAGDIQSALVNNDVMSFLRLNEAEVKAVAVYLKWLETQP